MQFLNTLSLLIAASLAAAAPAPHPVDERGTAEPTVWTITGYGNPKCKGHVLWANAGSGIGCKNAPLLAASYGWIVASRRPLEIISWAEPGICGNPFPGITTTPKKHIIPATVGKDWGEGCLNTPAYSVMVVPVAAS